MGRASNEAGPLTTCYSYQEECTANLQTEGTRCNLHQGKGMNAICAVISTILGSFGGAAAIVDPP